MAAVRQAPGWWPALVRAECDACGWVGPTRDTNTHTGRVLAKLDASDHTCGEEAGR